MDAPHAKRLSNRYATRKMGSNVIDDYGKSDKKQAVNRCTAGPPLAAVVSDSLTGCKVEKESDESVLVRLIEERWAYSEAETVAEGLVALPEKRLLGSATAGCSHRHQEDRG